MAKSGYKCKNFKKAVAFLKSLGIILYVSATFKLYFLTTKHKEKSTKLVKWNEISFEEISD